MTGLKRLFKYSEKPIVTQKYKRQKKMTVIVRRNGVMADRIKQIYKPYSKA